MKSQINDVEKWENRAAIAKEDPWGFLKWFVWTKDEHDKVTPIKKFPKKAMYRIITRVWQETDILFIEKSRQIMMTWIMACLYLWDAMFFKGRLIAYQSKKQEDADKIIGRARIVYNKLESLRFPGLPAVKKAGDKSGTTSKLEFPGQMSEIGAIPQGPDVVRSNTFSGILGDEMNHQPMFQKGYAAALPCINGGGKGIYQGTANGKNYCYRMMHNISHRTYERIGGNSVDSNSIANKRYVPDASLTEEQKRLWIERKIVEMPDDEFYAIPLEELIAMMPGMRYWVSAHGVTCLRVHYTADPDKDPVTKKGEAWKIKAKLAFDADEWEREMEINYDTFEGRPVINNWERDLFVKKTIFDPSLPLLLGCDFGTQVCGAFFAQRVPISGSNAKKLRFLDEIVLYNSNTPELAQAIVDKMKSRFPSAWEYADFLDFVDPAGNQKRETNSDKSQATSVDIFKHFRLKPKSKMIGIVDSTDLVKTVFSLVVPDGSMAVEIDPKCEYLISVVGGGWHYPPVDKGVDTGKPEKDGEFDHGGDMIRHIVANTFKRRDVGEHREKARPTKEAIRELGTGRIKGWRTRQSLSSRRGVDNYVRR